MEYEFISCFTEGLLRSLCQLMALIQLVVVYKMHAQWLCMLDLALWLILLGICFVVMPVVMPASTTCSAPSTAYLFLPKPNLV